MRAKEFTLSDSCPVCGQTPCNCTHIAESSLNEFIDAQTASATNTTPGQEKDVDVIFFGVPGRDWQAEDGWHALQEVLPREYPPNTEKAQIKVAEVAKNGGAIVTTKPLSIAQKLVKTFNAYGIRSKINQGMAEGLRDPKDNPCWKGYKPVGTKQKAGRTVPNCVPVDEAIMKVPANNADSAKKLYQYVARNLVDLASMVSFYADYKKPYYDKKFDQFFKDSQGKPVKVMFDEGGKIEFENGILYIPAGTYYQYRGFLNGQTFVRDVLTALGAQA